MNFPAYKVLRRPILTEKALLLAEHDGIYTFEVAKDAEKIAIKRAIEGYFNVKVAWVRTSRIPAKKRTHFLRRNIRVGRLPEVRKAFVKLKPGYRLPKIFEAG
ncbi:MAG: 50S ribosomal protein L23 [bacterium JZ-2024 1]